MLIYFSFLAVAPAFGANDNGPRILTPSVPPTRRNISSAASSITPQVVVKETPADVIASLADVGDEFFDDELPPPEFTVPSSDMQREQMPHQRPIVYTVESPEKEKENVDAQSSFQIGRTVPAAASSRKRLLPAYFYEREGEPPSEPPAKKPSPPKHTLDAFVMKPKIREDRLRRLR